MQSLQIARGAAVPAAAQRVRAVAPDAPVVPAPSLSRALEHPGFAARVAAEQALADRSGRSFCVVTCEITVDGARDLDALIAAAAGKLRASDVIVRVDDHLVAALLSDPARAARLESRLQSIPELRDARFVVTVHPYEPAKDGALRRASPWEQDPYGPPDRLPGPGIHWEERGVPLLLMRPLPRWKRAMDVVLASLGLGLAAVPMLLIALGIKLSSRGPVIYRQRRTGRAFGRFELYKFRTMHLAAEERLGELQHINQMTGPLFKSNEDPRIFPFGRLLRRTSADELPQLVNVLKGDMTLIGPRALSPVPTKYDTWQLRRFDVTPGIACTWQAFHRHETNFDAWMRSDLRYVDREPTLREDLWLLVSTVLAVLRCSGGR